jgi:hypothetical protein
MTRSLPVLKIAFIPIITAAAIVVMNQKPLKACDHGGYCDQSYTASATGYGADCDAATADAANQLNDFVYSSNACGVGESLCWTAPKQYGACNFDGTQYSIYGEENYGCGGCY